MTKSSTRRKARKTGMLPAADAAQMLAGAGFERVELIPGSTYEDSSTIILVPTRGTVDHRVVNSWINMVGPMNQKRAFLFAHGHEVGQAYNAMIERILAHPELSKYRYVMTMEDDNIQPPDAQIRLLESIKALQVDAVSGIYFTKGPINMPMAYGDPDEFMRTGVLDFRPRDIRDALKHGSFMRVNGIAMGCALWRTELFREISGPWFVTVADHIPGKGTTAFTQDLYFCERARRAGKTFAVDLRVKVGHLDISTGVIY